MIFFLRQTWEGLHFKAYIACQVVFPSSLSSTCSQNNFRMELINNVHGKSQPPWEACGGGLCPCHLAFRNGSSQIGHPVPAQPVGAIAVHAGVLWANFLGELSPPKAGLKGRDLVSTKTIASWLSIFAACSWIVTAGGGELPTTHHFARVHPLVVIK